MGSSVEGGDAKSRGSLASFQLYSDAPVFAKLPPLKAARVQDATFSLPEVACPVDSISLHLAGGAYEFSGWRHLDENAFSNSLAISRPILCIRSNQKNRPRNSLKTPLPQPLETQFFV